MGAKGPHTSKGSGGGWRPQRGTGAEPRWGSRGQAPGSKMNLTFDIAKNWLSLSIFNKFWSGWLIKNSRHPTTPKKILKSRVLQMPFPAFSRGISHQKDNHNWEQKTFIKSTFTVSSSCACWGYRSRIHTKKVYVDLIKTTKLQKRISASMA